MDTVFTACRSFFSDEEGISVVEYVVAAALIASALSAFFINFETSVGDKLNSTLNQ